MHRLIKLLLVDWPLLLYKCAGVLGHMASRGRDVPVSVMMALGGGEEV